MASPSWPIVSVSKTAMGASNDSNKDFTCAQYGQYVVEKTTIFSVEMAARALSTAGVVAELVHRAARGRASTGRVRVRVAQRFARRVVCSGRLRASVLTKAGCILRPIGVGRR